MTLVERCYDNIDAMTEGVAAEYADVVIDTCTCVLVRDVSLLCDSQRAQKLALSVSTLASKFLRCCVIVRPLHQRTSSR